MIRGYIQFIIEKYKFFRNNKSGLNASPAAQSGKREQIIHDLGLAHYLKRTYPAAHFGYLNLGGNPLLQRVHVRNNADSFATGL
jgi:hypothetical protein